MNDYRKNVNEAARETRYTIVRFLPLLIGVIVILGIVGFTLRSCGILGRTIVERKVFEESYQRSEALKSQIAVDEAVLVEIEHKLRNTNLDPDTRINLEAQASAARVRIATAKAKQE